MSIHFYILFLENKEKEMSNNFMVNEELHNLTSTPLGRNIRSIILKPM